MSENIYPEFARMLKREAKEGLLGQRGVVVWLYGLSGSGKSTIANAFERKLHDEGRMTKILDGDNIRAGLNRNLGFSDEDRAENVRRIAEVAKLFLSAGVITLTSFITPKRQFRAEAREIIGAEDFIEVYVRAPYEVCAARDPKGLYARAAKGEVKQFTGKDSAFEEPLPEDKALILDTAKQDLAASVEQLAQFIATRIGD